MDEEEDKIAYQVAKMYTFMLRERGIYAIWAPKIGDYADIMIKAGLLPCKWVASVFPNGRMEGSRAANFHDPESFDMLLADARKVVKEHG